MKNKDAAQAQPAAESPKRKFRWPMGPVRTAIFLVFLGVFVVSSGVLLKDYMEGKEAQEDFTKLKVAGAHDMAALHEQNPDIVGWLKIEGTRIDYPVMQTKKSPEFYLRRNFNKEHSMAGTPFMDARSDMSLPTLNWTIYGHNMKNGTMFHDLLKYEDEAFYLAHRTFAFDTLEGEGTYEVVAAFYTQIYTTAYDGFKYYHYNDITKPSELAAYIAGAKALGTYDTGVDVAPGEQVLTLSTCSYQVDDGRFVVVAKKIN